MTENIETSNPIGADIAAIVAAAVKAGIAEYAATQPSGPAPAGAGSVPLQRIRLADMASQALGGYTKSSKRTYKPYVKFLVDGWDGHAEIFSGYGDMWVDEILPRHLELAQDVVDRRAREAVEARNQVRAAAGRAAFAVGGKSAVYNAVGAWRWLFAYAEKNRHLYKGHSPAAEIDKPTRTDGTRMAFTETQLRQVLDIASGTGDDPELDALLCEAILVTGARQEGLLNLTLGYLDRDERVLWLDEKFGKVVPQPVPGWFFDKVYAFAIARGAQGPNDTVFRKRGANGKAAIPITGRRFDYIFTTRLQSAYSWADKEKVGAHTVRHHAVTLVERSYGEAIAQAFARHSSKDVTSLYTRASQQEVARAVIGLYGGDHPWLHREPRARPRG